MTNDFGLLISLGIVALISILVWIDYFRKIDVFEQEKLSRLFIAILIGSLTPFLSLVIYDLYDIINFNLNGEPFNDLLYSILGIGLNEELCKIVGCIIAFRVLRKTINESIDYLIYAGMVALGFALVENFFYIRIYGVDILTNRSFYSVLEHIINTSIITYGYFRFKIFSKGHPVLNTITGIFLATMSHGLFDYFILSPNFRLIAPLLVIGVYLIGINFWITMLNNCINYSRYFDYQKLQYPGKIFYRLIAWYFLTVVVGTIYKSLKFGFGQAIETSLDDFIAHGFLFIVVIMRASRFRIYRNLYQKVTVKLPFYLTKNGDEDFRIFHFLAVKIRGENPREYYLTKKIGQKIEVIPLSKKRGMLRQSEEAQLIDKLFIDKSTTIYKIRFQSSELAEKTYYLKPKTSGKVLFDNQHPVASLHSTNKSENLINKLKDLPFIEWTYVKTDNLISKVNY